MKKTQLPYQETGFFSKLILDYLEGKDELKSLYNQYCDIESFSTIIEQRKKSPINRAVLTTALNQQCKDIAISELTKSNFQLLNNANCFTVTTGHQLNLFTGPLYFIYKIISTINLAKELKAKYPSNDFVPVYWMATEDHDFEEINHFNLFEKRYELTNSKNGTVGQLKLEGVENLLGALKEDLGDRTRAEEVLALFSKFYSPDKTYAEAIKGIVNHLFGKYGLVIIDGDDKALKSLFIDELKNELLNRNNHILINQTSEKLKNIGFKPQLTPREINIFYLQEGLRERIVFEDNKYKVLNTQIEFSELEIIKEVENYPERFSPNAPMRSMYQEKILPNLAYVGGGGELAYWFQLKTMFNANNISYPILILRNSVLFIDKGNDKRLSKLGIEAKDLFNDADALIKKYLKKEAEIVLDLKQEEKDLVDIFESIIDKSGAIDQSLQSSVKAELQKNINSLKSIESRLIKAEKQKQAVSVNQITTIKDKLFPTDSLQERHDNLISLILFYGEDVIDELVQQLHPLDKQFVILTAE